mmetsp:Transcript_78076/g.216872  ORF Transcript_78076/g.216872 Transcript_78076/m.216872 type:complete len:124 (-) Transcript_78076:92-463(-)
MGSEKPFVTKAERLENARQEQLKGLALDLFRDLKRDCIAADVLGKRTLTWGAILPAAMCGKSEDTDEVLKYFSEEVSKGPLTSVEWCKAAAPTQWISEPVRFGSHVHIRVYWEDNAWAGETKT